MVPRKRAYTAAERKRRSRQKKRNELGEEGYLRQQAEKEREWRKNRDLNPAQREQQKRKERAKKGKQRGDKKLMENAEKKRTSTFVYHNLTYSVHKFITRLYRIVTLRLTDKQYTRKCDPIFSSYIRSQIFPLFPPFCIFRSFIYINQ